MLVGSFIFEDKPTQICSNMTANTDFCDDGQETYTFIIISSLAAFAVFLNLICFIKLSQKRRHTVMRRNLLMLSATECIFSFTMVLDYVLFLSGYCLYNDPTSIKWIKVKAPIANLILILGDTTLCTRNWCNVLISAARTEVIIQPLKSWRIFSRTRVLIYYAIIMLVSFTLSTLRTFRDTFSSCMTPLKNDTKHMESASILWEMSPSEPDIWVFIYFSFQVVLPLGSVIIMTSLIIYHIAPCTQKEIIDNATRRRHHKKATTTVLLLASIFTIFETPTFIFATMTHVHRFFEIKSVFYNTYIENSTTLVFISEMCIILDSVFNFLAYSTAVPEIREQLEYMFCCLCKFYCAKRGKGFTIRKRHSKTTIVNDFSTMERSEALLLNKATQRNVQMLT